MFFLMRLWIIIFSFMFSFVVYADYKVRTVYFIPTDSQDKLEQLDLDDIMKSIQTTYLDEMNRHGFHNKTFELETNNKGKVVVHKVKGNKNKAFYQSNPTLSVVQSELASKGYSSNQSIYAVVMADMRALSGGASGLGALRPLGGWTGNKEYYGMCVSIETTPKTTTRILMHELGHCFGLYHIVLYDSSDFIMGSGYKLAFHEARWLSKNQYFNKTWTHNLGPEIIDFHNAKNQNNGKITISATVKDTDGLFQAYGFVDTASASYAIVGFNFYNGTVNAPINFTDIDRHLLTNSNEIYFQLMDTKGNWRFHHPNIYTLPEEINKNEDLGIVEENDDTTIEDCIICEIDEEDIAWNVKLSKTHLTTSWAKIKSQR